jgi:periplasmic copper chaperone A
MRNRFVLIATAAMLALPALAHDYRAGALRLMHPHASAPVQGQGAVGVHLVIENTAATPDRLLSASSDAAGSVMLHVPAAAGAGMLAAHALEIPASGRVELGMQGAHIMVDQLDHPLKPGERFPLRLVFERAGAVLVDVLVDSDAPGKMQEAHRAH